MTDARPGPAPGHHDVVSIAAHELHHDVQAARDLVGELRRNKEDDAFDVASVHRRLEQSLALLERNIDRLLVQGGANLDRLNRAPTNLGELVRRVVAAHPSGDHPVEIDAASVILNVDAVKVERIVDNLLVNALHHTPPGCRVRLHLSMDIAIGPLGVVLTVEDEGPGLPGDVQAKLLSPEATPPKAETMGLWIVVHFARLHGGDVSVSPGPNGRGACFRVRLPA